MCKEKFINPFTDFGFKRLFGSAANKESMISFLNSLFDEEDKIVEITYQNTEHFGLSAADRMAIYDLYCTTDKGSHFIVEMQNGYQRYFLDRSVYYSSFPMQEEAKKGTWDYKLPKIYMVAFLNFKMDQFVTTPEYRHTLKLCDLTSKEVIYDKLTFVYLEMPKFDLAMSDLKTNFDRWMYIIKNLDQLNERPPEFRDEVFRRFFERARIAAFTHEERVAYELSLKQLRDYHNTINSAIEKGRAYGLKEGFEKGRAEGIEEGREKGRAEGIEEGREKGRAEGIEEGREKGRAEGEKLAKLEIAYNLKKQGVTAEAIALGTGLSIDEIRRL